MGSSSAPYRVLHSSSTATREISHIVADGEQVSHAIQHVRPSPTVYRGPPTGRKLACARRRDLSHPNLARYGHEASVTLLRRRLHDRDPRTPSRASRERREALGLAGPEAAAPAARSRRPPPPPSRPEPSRPPPRPAARGARRSPGRSAAARSPIRRTSPPPSRARRSRSGRCRPWSPCRLGRPLRHTLEPPTGDRRSADRRAGRSTRRNCAGCHGASGGGGVGPALDRRRRARRPSRTGDDQRRCGCATERRRPTPTAPTAIPTGRRPAQVDDCRGVMPAFADLTDEELLAVVRYEREVLERRRAGGRTRISPTRAEGGDRPGRGPGRGRRPRRGRRVRRRRGQRAAAAAEGVTDDGGRARTTSSSSAAGRRGRRRRTGWPTPATTSSSSSARPSPARRPAATA